jgi:hypothetical protein
MDLIDSGIEVIQDLRGICFYSPKTTVKELQIKQLNAFNVFHKLDNH